MSPASLSAAAPFIELLAHPALTVGLLTRLVAALVVGGLPLGHHVPARVRLALAVALLLVALPAAAPAASMPADSLPLLLLTEAVVGLGFGLIAAVVSAAAAWAGAVVGSVAGLSWAGDFTVGGEADAGGTAQFAWWCGVAAFFTAGGHLVVVAGLLDSVRFVPVGAVACHGAAGAPLVHAVTGVPSLALELALAVATPALAAIVTFHLATAIALRTLGFPPGQGFLQAATAVVLLAAIMAGADVWLGGFGSAASRLIGQELAAAAGR